LWPADIGIKKIGTSVKKLVDSKFGYKVYFAEYVQSLDALVKNIFDGLRRCSGLIAFLHARGLVTTQEDSIMHAFDICYKSQQLTGLKTV